MLLQKLDPCEDGAVHMQDGEDEGPEEGAPKRRRPELTLHWQISEAGAPLLATQYLLDVSGEYGHDWPAMVSLRLESPPR